MEHTGTVATHRDAEQVADREFPLLPREARRGRGHRVLCKI